MPGEIEYFYSTRSSFAYLGHAEIVGLARKHGRRLIHRPMLLAIVVPGTGGLPFDRRHPARLAQAWDDLQRWADFREIPIQRQDPKHHVGPLELPSGLVVAAQYEPGLGQDRLDRLAFEILAALWRDDRDIADPEVLRELCANAGLAAEADRLLETALAEAAQAEIQNNSQEAVRRGIIGAPSYAVDGEIYFGQDRLDFVARALQAADLRS
ncbi:MAG: 2-hydroxychromene-2-carboxylate isomerase [Rhodovibrionaceae bacterium]